MNNGGKRGGREREEGERERDTVWIADLVDLLWLRGGEFLTIVNGVVPRMLKHTERGEQGGEEEMRGEKGEGRKR